MLFRKDEKLALFLHLPKTGGNSIQSTLIDRNMSLDKKLLIGHQDGENRFEIRGDYTYSKHQPLIHYLKLDPKLSDCEVYICVRNPIDRLVSLYLSPNRWMTFDKGTQEYVLPKEIGLNFKEFTNMVNEAQSCISFLGTYEPLKEVENISLFKSLIKSGKLNFLHTENLSRQFQALFGFNLNKTRKNVSTLKDIALEIKSNKRWVDVVAQSHHMLDCKFIYNDIMI